MILLVVAESEQDYENWLAHQREEASAASASIGAEGRTVFLSKPCALCHTIRGTPARGGVGPDLTHIASRQRLASNMLANDEANLAAWITHAQSLKPGADMPDITQFTGEELQATVTYLRLLK
jgi:cytochrome c oxidase subunit 2